MAGNKIILSESERAEAARCARFLSVRLGPTKAAIKVSVAKTTLWRWRVGTAVPTRIKYRRLLEVAKCVGQQ
jgi:hypothetical protein